MGGNINAETCVLMLVNMFYSVLLLVIASAQTLSVRPTVPLLDGRIVGGSVTSIERRPYQLSLQYGGNHMCGASLIRADVALTAAHCTNGFQASYFSVRGGSTYRGSGGQVVPVSTICEHPGYNAGIIDNDVSVLRLAFTLSIGSKIQTIPLQPLNQDVSVGSYATVSGWGAVSEGGSSSNVLREVTLVRVSDSSCTKAYGANKITSRMICFGYPSGGRDSCQGDSGGPLNGNGAQVGIVSWGYGCARPQYPGVYTKISHSFIRSHIDRCMA